MREAGIDPADATGLDLHMPVMDRHAMTMALQSDPMLVALLRALQVYAASYGFGANARAGRFLRGWWLRI